MYETLIPTDICYYAFLMAGILLGRNWYFIEVLTSISLTANDVEHLFYIYFLAIDNPFLLILLILL